MASKFVATASLDVLQPGDWQLGSGQRGLVSVIVTAYNQDWVIGETLATVAAQTYRPIECIIVNDGSQDGSAEIIDDFVRNHAGTLNIRVIHQKNQGAQGARNTGVRASSGELIQFFDGDDLLAPDKIRAQAEFLTSAEGQHYDATYGDSQWIHGVGDSAKVGEVIGVGPSGDILRSLIELDPFNPPFAYLSRRAAVERTGPWDASLVINDDVDYFLQMACKSLAIGQDFKYLPVFTGYYRTHSGPRISEGGMALRAKFTHQILRHTESTMHELRLLTPERKQALARTYYRISNWAATWHWPVWRPALADTIRVDPRFAPERPRARFLQSLLGVWGAETLKAIRWNATARLFPHKPASR